MATEHNILTMNGGDATALHFPYTVLDTTGSVATYNLTPSKVAGSDEFLSSTHAMLRELVDLQNRQVEKLQTEVPAYEGNTRHENIQQQWWFTPLMVLLFIGFAYVGSQKRKFFYQEQKVLLQANAKNSFANELVPDSFGVRTLLHILSTLNTSLFCYFALIHLFHYTPSSHATTLALVTAVIFTYVCFKLLSIAIVCFIYFENGTFANMKRLFSDLTSFMNIVLFPLVVLIAYAQPTLATIALWTGVLVCALFTLLYLYKILSFFFQGLSSLFYLILYLCTLEILPTIALIAGLINAV